jgi:hypothetical protein
MEIIAQIQSFSFYHESKTIYITADTIKTTIKDQNHKDIFRFKSIQAGQKICFKSKTVDFAEIVKTLRERIVFIKVLEIELNRDCKNPTPPKLIFESIKSCDISPAN